jgi:hypothetical protein
MKSKLKLDHKTCIRNILHCWDQSTDAEKAEGANWYSGARAELEALAKDAGLPFRAVVHAAAALSPMVSWEENIKGIRLLLQGEERGIAGFGRNRRKAADILQYAREGQSFEWLLSGQKVTAFAKCLEDPDSDEVVIDTHAASVALWTRYTATTLFALTPKRYRALQDAYRVAAKRVGIPPTVLQATTWVSWRNQYGNVRNYGE